MATSNNSFIDYLLHKNSTHFQVRKLQKKLRDEDGSVVMMSVWMLSFDEWLEWADYSPMLWKYNNGNMNNKPAGNVLFWSSPDLHCEVIAGQQLDTSCQGELCPVLSSRCPVLATFVLRSNNLRDATKRRHLQSKEAMGQIWNWTEECLRVRVACRRKLPS